MQRTFVEALQRVTVKVFDLKTGYIAVVSIYEFMKFYMIFKARPRH